jgi:hypothetical protein
MGLSLLLGGIGVEMLALAWLITFAATNGAAPIPVAPEAPSTRALVLMVVGFVAIARGYVMAIIHRTREEHRVADRVADGREDTGAAVAAAISEAYAARFACYRRRLTVTTAVGTPVMIVGPLLCFAAGGSLPLGVAVGAIGLGVFGWGYVGGVTSMGRLVQRDLVAAGYPIRRPAPLQSTWSLRAWAERNRLTPQIINQAAARRPG